MKFNQEVKVLAEIYKSSYHYHTFKNRFTDNDDLPVKLKLAGQDVSDSLEYLKAMNLIKVDKSKLIKLTERGFEAAREGIKHRWTTFPAFTTLYLSLIIAITNVCTLLYVLIPEQKGYIFTAYTVLIVIVALTAYNQSKFWTEN